MKDLSYYIHVPFCQSKCYYCDFVSYPYSFKDVSNYLTGLDRELKLYSELISSVPMKTIYIGGGTPSCLTLNQLADLLRICRRYFPVGSGDVEATVEVNPGTISREKLLLLKENGINRISLGVQALQDEHLLRLGRRHRVKDIKDSYSLIRKAGFNNVNMDLIFALPGQTLSQWEDTLNEVMVLAPEHISTYNLVIEEGTKFHRWQRAGKLLPICEELDLKMYQMARELLSKEGYMHYEISSFAHGGRSCEHNLTYWRNKSYLGFGPGAHSYYNGERRGNTADISKYANELSKGLSPASFRETIGEEMEQVETMILGLRLSRGIAREEFRYRFGCDPIEVFGENISPLRAEGLLKVDEERLSLTEKGLIFANQVFMAFLPE